MATTSTAVLSSYGAAGSGQAKQSVTLTWTAGVISRVFSPPLPAGDSGPTDIIRRDFYGVRSGAYITLPGQGSDSGGKVGFFGDITQSFPYVRNPFGIDVQPYGAVSLSPGEHTREFGSLSDDEYMRLKTAEFALRKENGQVIVSYDNAMAMLMAGRPTTNEVG